MYTTPLVLLPRFCIGHGVYAYLRQYCAWKNLGRNFVVIGGETAMRKGLPKLMPYVDDASVGSARRIHMLAALPFGGACTDEAVDRLTAQIKKMRPDFIVGMGGGKAVDTAKAVARALMTPVVTMPTLISNCAPITALSVMYTQEGAFKRFQFMDTPPELTLIDLDIAADAPEKFLRAGMGDTLAKHLESTFSARGDELGVSLDHMSAMGVALSSTCYDPILKYGRQALEEAKAHKAGAAFELCARSIILSAGMVSLLADDNYNCALAHSVCYGLQRFEHVERNHLHGDLVAYGAVVQLVLDGQPDRAKELKRFLSSLGTPVTLAEMNVPLEREVLHDALLEATTGPDMAHIPYPITPDMVFDAMRRAETL